MWVPRHVGIRGNEAADRAAKEALDKKPTADLMPFSDLKPLTAKYVYQLWRKEWDETVFLSNNFHEILPKLPETLFSFCNTGKEDTVLNMYWSLLFNTFLYFDKRRGSCLCCMYCCNHS